MPEPGIIARYRETHHRIAQMFALGMTPSMIRQQTGVSQRRLTLYWSDPAFQELIRKYSGEQEEKLRIANDALTDLAVGNMLLAEQMIVDRLHESLEEDGEQIPIATLNRLFESRADRFGYGKHSTIKHEHDFAAALDRAIERSGKKIELQATEVKELPPPKPPAPKIPASFVGVFQRLKVA